MIGRTDGLSANRLAYFFDLQTTSGALELALVLGAGGVLFAALVLRSRMTFFQDYYWVPLVCLHR